MRWRTRNILTIIDMSCRVGCKGRGLPGVARPFSRPWRTTAFRRGVRPAGQETLHTLLGVERLSAQKARRPRQETDVPPGRAFPTKRLSGRPRSAPAYV